MSGKNRNDLKGYFAAHLRPTESQFGDLIDSFVNISDDDFVNTTELNQAITAQAPGLAPVQSVNGFTGAVTIPAPPVSSVNGATGAVMLTDFGDSGWQAISYTIVSPILQDISAGTSPRYRKLSGVVHLDGCFKGGPGQTNNLTFKIFNLPSGYRPSRKMSFSILKADATPNYTIGRIDIDSNGDVFGVCYSATWNSLSGISFLIG